MTDKTTQELQEEIDFLKGQVECLTGITALQLSVYFKLLKNTTDKKILASQISAISPEQAFENALNIGFERISKEQNQHIQDGFNEAKNHCLDLLRLFP